MALIAKGDQVIELRREDRKKQLTTEDAGRNQLQMARPAQRGNLPQALMQCLCTSSAVL